AKPRLRIPSHKARVSPRGRASLFLRSTAHDSAIAIVNNCQPDIDQAVTCGSLSPARMAPTSHENPTVKIQEEPSVRKALLAIALCAFVLGVAAIPQMNAQVTLLAVGSLTSSQAGSYADLSGLHNTLESGAP